MEEVLLDVDAREVTGKAVKRLRAEGLVPAVIHDHGKASVHITGAYVPMMKA
jgi:ribosomal protein L25 (general stress protein Ctc)